MFHSPGRNKKHDKAQGNQGEKPGRVRAEEAEGDAGVPDERHMKDARKKGERTLRGQIGKYQKFTELVQEDDKKYQAVERDYRRRFFFSSSSWHLMHRGAWGTAMSRFWGMAFSQFSHAP